MALPFGPYEGQDLTSYQEGNKFLPRQFYSLNSPIQANTIENTGGITSTIPAWQQQGFSSYEAWLLAQGGGSGNGGGNDPVDNINRGGINQNLGPTNITDYESEAYGVGPTWKGTWARAQDLYSKLPTPGNLIRKGIRHWKEKRDARRVEEAAASKAGKDAADAAAAGQGTNIGGGWTQTNTGDGGATFTGGGGQTHQGWSNTPAGFAAAAESEASFAQGGRIGYRDGEFVEDINVEGPGFDENVMMASDDNNTRILENLFEKYLELGFSPEDAETKAREEFNLMSQGLEQGQGIASLV